MVKSGEVGRSVGFALLFVVFVLRVRSHLFGGSLDVVCCCAAGQIWLGCFHWWGVAEVIRSFFNISV